MKILYSLLIVLILSMVIGISVFFYKFKDSKKLSFPQQENTSNFNKEQNAYNNNDFESASSILDKKLSVNNQDIDALLAKATVLAQQGSLNFKEKSLGDQARVFVNNALQIDPAYSPSFTILGYTYEIQENYVEAHKAYDKAILLDAQNYQALSQKAHAYDLQGNIKEAKNYYEKALAINPNDQKTLSGYGRILIISGNIEKAKTVFEKVINSENVRVSAEAYYTLGSLNEKKTYSQVAEDYYANAIATDPTLPMAYVGLAKEEFKKALETKDKVESQKLIDSSFANLETALKINPNQSYASLQLAIQMMTIGNKDFALKVLERLSKNTFNDITLNQQDRENLQIIAINMIKTINKGK